MATIGIDLGTTNSCVSIMQGGEPFVIPNEEGSTTTPSVVAFTKDGEKIVGAAAKRQLVVNLTSTFFAVKRIIGRKIDSDSIKNFLEFSSFPIVPDNRNNACVKVNERVYSMQEISSFVLTKIKSIAEQYLDQTVQDAVITVPAHFNNIQRSATRDAGIISGLNVVRIINEPTAAALAYGYDKESKGTLAVYDLGGSTFDISILRVEDGVFRVLSTNGDNYLGGYDFDLKLLEYVIKDFQDEYGIDLKEDKVALQKVNLECEKAKHELSSVDETEIRVNFIAVDKSGPKHLNLKINRTKLEELTGDLVEKTAPPCIQAIQDSGLTIEEIDHVVLVGGMTRMPLIRKKVEEIFGKYSDTNMNPEEAVAIGAAIQGNILELNTNKTILHDITPLSLGVETKNGIFTKIIKKNTPIPIEKKLTFTTTKDNQSVVNIHILQGEREMADDNTSLAKFSLLDIPPELRGVPEIEVNFSLDNNCILQVSARDLKTGNMQEMNVEDSTSLSSKELVKLIKESEDNMKLDKQKKKIASLRNKADNSIYSMNKLLEKLTQSQREVDIKLESDMQIKLKDLEKTLDGEDHKLIDTALLSFNEALHKFSESIFKPHRKSEPEFKSKSVEKSDPTELH